MQVGGRCGWYIGPVPIKKCLLDGTNKFCVYDFGALDFSHFTA